MKRSSSATGNALLLFGMWAGIGVQATAQDGDAQRGGSPCERTARAMASSCYFAAGADLQLAVANCLNVEDGGERDACFDDARAARTEEVSFCGDVQAARVDACGLLGEWRYAPDPLQDPDNELIDPDDVPGTFAPNPYVSLAAGHTYVLHAGEEGEELVVVHATADSREILGASCRVVADVVVEVTEEDGTVEYEAVEVTDDWFAQDTAGNVYYCGEISRNYEDGLLRDIGGSFEAGRDFAKAGTLVLQYPVEGEAHRTEFALGEAEDIVQYLALQAAPTAEEGGDNPRFPCSTADGPGDCLKTLDFAPIEPESTEHKYYLPGTGLVLAVAFEEGEVTGEREELICVGDSLDVLEDPSCEIADPAALLEELCELAPQAFCGDAD